MGLGVQPTRLIYSLPTKTRRIIVDDLRYATLLCIGWLTTTVVGRSVAAVGRSSIPRPCRPPGHATRATRRATDDDGKENVGR